MDAKKKAKERERDRHTLRDEHGVHVLCVWKTFTALQNNAVDATNYTAYACCVIYLIEELQNENFASRLSRKYKD